MHYSTSLAVKNGSQFPRRTHEEDIYEDLCYVTLRIGKDALEEDVSGTLTTTPLENRDYCIRELVETEKNYVEALNMIIRHFVRPLKKILDGNDRKVIFNHIKELADIHTGFHRDLVRASSGSYGLRISSCFLNWKDRFVVYGDYCANLPRAQTLIDELCSKNNSISEAVSRHQMEANDGKFKLRDLLSLPMQRILKYHLFLKELIKNTSEAHDDYYGLQQAYEAMIDIGDYINEVKRDSETLQIIAGIQANIVDLDMPENTELKDYGRLLRDGEVKMKNSDDKCYKSRYVFVFDKVMLMCKSLKGEQFSYKEALILTDFSVDESPSTTTPSHPTIKHFKDKWCHQWSLVHNQSRYTYTFYVKSEELKKKWIEALDKALDTVNPEAVRNGLTDHTFIMTTFSKPQTCGYCDKLLPGLFFQGYKCTLCEIPVHKACIPLVKSCGELCLPPRPPLPSSSPSVISAYSGGEDDAFLQNSPVDFLSKYSSSVHHAHHLHHHFPSNQPHQFHGRGSTGNGTTPNQLIAWPHETKVKAISSFEGTASRGELSFSVGDVLLITNPKPDIGDVEGKWMEGELLRTGVEGLFPVDKVIPIQSHHSRSSSSFDDSSSHNNNNNVNTNNNNNNNNNNNSINTIHLLHHHHNNHHSNGISSNLFPNYVNLNLEEHSWFAGTMDRSTAQSLLEKLPNSTFLVRISPNQKGNYAISLNCNGIVKHMKICKTSEGQFYLSESKYFDTVVELVKWYEERTLAESFSGLNLKLGIPYKKVCSAIHQQPIGYAIALYSFTGNSANLLALRKGDYIAILSKTGEEKGWWKGQIGQRIGYFPFAYVSEIKD